jgi:urea carboxylase system permease
VSTTAAGGDDELAGVGYREKRDRSIAAAGEDDLAEFGYRQELDRSIGKFASFAAGVSYISILTGTFQLFFFGFASGGPAYWWSWPLVFAGQLMIALCFAELAAAYPVAGSVYNWSKRLGSATVAWLAGWMMLTASLVTIAAVALANQYALPQIWSALQLIGDGTGKYDFSVNAVILGTALIVFTTLVNAWGVKLMSRINSTGVFIELIAAVLLVILLAVNIKRGPDTLFDSQGKGAGHAWGYAGAFLVASLASAYVMYGFDTASSLGEETIDPRRTAPKAILRAVNASFLLGGAILLCAILAANNLADERIASGGMQFIILDVLGNTVGKAILIAAAIAIWVCCLAVQTATIRMIFAMARDNNLPAGSVLAKVHPKYKTPVVPAVLTGIIAVVILLVNIRQPQIFTVITSIGIIMIYIAYLLVTAPMLVSRLRGRWPPPGAPSGYFSLGRLGLPINVVAVVWGALMALNLAWPRKEVYNATEPFHWYLQWGAFLFIGIVFFGGLAYYRLVQRHKTGVLEEHAAGPATAPAVAGGAD